MTVPPWLRHAARTVLHLTADSAAIALAYRLSYLVRFEWPAIALLVPPHGIPLWSLYGHMLYAVIPLWLMIFWYSGRLYNNPWLSAADRFLQILKGCALAAGATMVATYIYSRLEYSRLMLACALPFAVALVTLAHAFVLWIDSCLARVEAARPVLLIGGGLLAQEIAGRVKARHPGAEIVRRPDLPNAVEFKHALSKKSYCEVILLISSLPHQRILEAAELCGAHGTAFKMIPDLLELRLGEIHMDQSLGLPAYRIEHASLTPLNFIAKRTFDLVFSIFVLIATLPFNLIACVLIKIDSFGPVLYRQKRYGYKAQIFEAYKFRTMTADAEARVTQIKAQHARDGAFFKAKEDSRITRVGRWLRRFSIDEFPQFLNVLRGEMSVVGPRPLALTTGEKEALEQEFGVTAHKRMNTLPGITGLWQVSGRSDVSSAQRFALDLFYIEHWSLGLDLEIILKTVPAMIFGKGAY